jgi:hypothetical protein
MQLTLTRPLNWRALGILVLGAVSLGVSIPVIVAAPDWSFIDLHLFAEAGDRIAADQNPYIRDASEMSFRWSPLMAWLFAIPLGVWGWTALALASLALLRDWRLIAGFLVAYPFWRDLELGASFWFVPLLAIIALRGSYWGGVAFAAATFLVPRPMMLPVLAWLLWQRHHLRIPTVVAGVVVLAGSFATGWGFEWIAHLREVAAHSSTDLPSPGQLLGPAWAIMLPISAWVAWKGHLGIAALTISPYWTPAYLLMLLLELTPRTPARN